MGMLLFSNRLQPENTQETTLYTHDCYIYAAMKISELLNADNILLDIDAADKDALISRLVGQFRTSLGEELAARILEAVLRRERIMSTAVGKGVAIPHAKVEGMESHHIVFARLRHPVDFGESEMEPVRLVLLIAGANKNAGVHIKLLSKVSRVLNHDNFRNQLLKARDAGQIIHLFQEEEQPVG
jgi:mannitol/fructose-specific phosphotransferase system IIA component (Ntr-type)